MMPSYTNAPLCRQRRHIETLLARSSRLGAEDKALLEMVFSEGISLRQVARLTGANPSTVSRRFRRLIRHLTGRGLRAAAYSTANRDRLDSRIIQEYFLQGRSQKFIARKYNTNLYRVRRALRTVQANTSRNRISERSHPCIP